MKGDIKDRAIKIVKESASDTPETFISKVYSGIRADPLLISEAPLSERFLHARGIVNAILEETDLSVPKTSAQKPKEEVKETEDKEKKEKTEEPKKETEKKDAEKVTGPRTIAFVTKPTLSPTDEAVVGAKAKTESQLALTQDAGPLKFSDQQLQEIGTYHSFKKPPTQEEITAAWHLYQGGVTGQQLAAAHDSQTFLTEIEADSLDNIAKLTELLSLQDEVMSAELVLANEAPELTLQDYSAAYTLPAPPSEIFITQSNDQGLNPILQTGVDFAKDQVQGFAQDALKKGAEKLVSRGAQTAVSTTGEAAVSATGEAVTVGAAETAVAGTTAAGGAAAGGAAAAGTAAAGGAAVAGGAAAAGGAAVAGGAAAAGGTAVAVAGAEAAAGPPGWVALAVEAVIALALAAGAIVVKGLQKLVTTITGEKDTRQSIMALSMVMLMGGIGLTSPLLIGLGGLGFVGSAYALAGGVGIASGVFGFFSAAFLGFMTVVVPSLVMPLVIAFIVVPLFIILVVLIIFMGGYVVPPNPARTIPNALTSAYIKVDKVAESPGHPADNYQTYDNNELPITVTFTITITPLQGTLTNVIFNARCTVLSRTNNSLTCPPEQNITIDGQSVGSFPPPAPAIISAAQVVTITYIQSFNNSFVDSAVNDTFTVTADVPGHVGESAAGTAGLCIGNCPQDCPAGWPVGPEGSETQLQVTQGPYASASHRVLDGVDITNFDSASHYASMNGHTIQATHAGLFCAPPGEVDRYGNVVYVVGQCNGQQFATVYAHIMPGSAALASGSHVTRGQNLALSDDTGGWNFPHLHYEFANAGGDGSTCSGFWAQPQGTEPNMTTIYGVPQGCFWNCGVTIP